MQLGLKDRLFVVTGAAQGIGSAIVKSLVEEGATVAALDIDAEGLQALASLAGVRTYAGDLSRAEDAHRLCKRVLDEQGAVHGLVTAAGGVRGQVGKPLESVSEADWHSIFNANVDAAMWCAQVFAPAMKAAGSGRIVTLSSGAGLRPSLTGIQSYAAAKHALVGLTKQLALELGPDGITVNSVAPGFVLSNPSTARQWEAFGQARQEQVLHGIHMRRLGCADDIADAVLFLCSERAAWISGQILSVDGGHA
ncbi:SDR family NAD(P)-dependent oxidoreductase [Congregibacter sp.]|uniref:SDR family NAD(P)-dependent oxidoreductase n=1 Tax=Congregibacter sp. TaxID=2744308 RepID=UPI003F6C52A5